jgi:glycosyltransferase involved in cell wall biosynthesis
MPGPLVSVVMITYNQEKYIAEAIESVLSQEAPFQFELVIGEDCSTDGTREIVSTYQKNYPEVIRVITGRKNVGMILNFIRTGRACTGEFLAFCEGDDYWHRRDKLKLQVEYLEGHAGCGLVCSNYDVRDVGKGTIIRNFLTYKKWEIAETFKLSDWVSSTTTVPILTVTVMSRRSLFEKVIDADPYLYEGGVFLMYDVPLWAEMSALSKVGYIADSLATYNVSDNSVTRSRDVEKNLRFTISACEMGLYLCKKYGIAEDKRIERQQKLWITSLELACHTRNKTLAEDMRQKMGKLRLIDWFRYYAAKSYIVYFTFAVLRTVKRVLASRERKWYE